MTETLTSPEPLVELAGVEKTFYVGETAVPVLRGVDMVLPRGELSVVLGASGSGKSTLLNLIGGIDRPTAGTLTFDGADITRWSDRQLTRYRRDSVGFVFQFYNLVPTLTALENVAVATEISDDPMDPADALELVGMTDRSGYFPAQLSGGQQQRVSLARAIAKRPRLLLCDEPTGALDEEMGRHVLQILLDVQAELGTTTVIITHALGIGALGHRVLRIASGRISMERANAERATVEEIDW